MECYPTAENGGSAITGWIVSRDGTDINGVGAWSSTYTRRNPLRRL